MDQIRINQEGLLRKIGILDMMLESLGKVDKEQGEAVDEMVKKISTRKLLLMDELFKLLSSLSV
jgi:hypothetical protein